MKSSKLPLNKKLYVGRLDCSINSEKLSKFLIMIFQQYGNLVRNPIVKQGFGFVEFDSFTSAKNAKEKENGRMIGMYKIIVDYAKPRSNTKKQFIQQNMFTPPTQMSQTSKISVNLYITHNSAWAYALNVQKTLNFNGIGSNILFANQYDIQHVVSKEKFKIVINSDNAMRSSVWFDVDKGYHDTDIYDVIKFIKIVGEKPKFKEYDPCNIKSVEENPNFEEYDPSSKQYSD